MTYKIGGRQYVVIAAGGDGQDWGPSDAIVAFARRPRREVILQYMVIENFRGGDPVPVYRRFRDRGRLAPDGLRYVGSWITTDLKRCYQVMECDDRRLLDEWLATWQDIVEFEVVPTMSSAEALAAVTPRL